MKNKTIILIILAFTLVGCQGHQYGLSVAPDGTTTYSIEKKIEVEQAK